MLHLCANISETMVAKMTSFWDEGVTKFSYDIFGMIWYLIFLYKVSSLFSVAMKEMNFRQSLSTFHFSFVGFSWQLLRRLTLQINPHTYVILLINYIQWDSSGVYSKFLVVKMTLLIKKNEVQYLTYRPLSIFLNIIRNSCLFKKVKSVNFVGCSTMVISGYVFA